VKQAFNQVNVREHHAAAAVTVQLELRERLALGAPVNEQREVRVPLVTDNLAAAKAANRNDLLLVQKSLLTIAGTDGAVTVVDRPAAVKKFGRGSMRLTYVPGVTICWHRVGLFLSTVARRR